MESNKIDVEKSRELKKVYRHRIRKCYNNAWALLDKKEIDYIAIGYLKEGNEFIRHAWGMKDNLIIDTTLNKWKKEDIDKLSYYELFHINNIGEIIRKTSSGSALELDVEKEYLFLKEKLKEDWEIIWCAERNNHVLAKYIYKKIGTEKLFEQIKGAVIREW